MKKVDILKQMNDEEYLCFKNILTIIQDKEEIILDDLRIGTQEDREIKTVLEIIDNEYLNQLLKYIKQDDGIEINRHKIVLNQEITTSIARDLSEKLSIYKNQFYKNELNKTDTDYLLFQVQKEFLENEYISPGAKKYGDTFSVNIRLNNKYQLSNNFDVLPYQTFDTMEDLEYLSIHSIKTRETRDKRIHGLDYEIELEIKIRLNNRYLSNLTSIQKDGALFLIKTFEQEGSLYADIDGNQIPLSKQKKVYDFLSFFQDNLSSVDRKILMKKFESKDGLGNILTRVKKELKAIGFVIESQKQNHKTSYKIIKK